MPGGAAMKHIHHSRRLVILISLFPRRQKDSSVSLAQGSIGAVLRGMKNIDLLPFDIDYSNMTESALDILARKLVAQTGRYRAENVDICIGVYVWNDHMVQGLLERLRQQGFAGRIILGGPQISYAGPGLDTLYPQADLFIRGYAEQVLAEILSDPIATGVPGVHRAGTPDLLSRAVLDPSTLPSPWLTGENPVRRHIHWETKRGCPYACSYCQHDGLVKRRVVEFPLERISREIELFVQRGVQSISVLDPVFNVGKSYLDVLGLFHRSGYSGRLSIQCRPELVNKEFLDAMKGLDVFPEFGLQTIHDTESTAVNRINNPGKVKQVFAEINEREISFMVTLIYGLPFQTLESFRQSVDWCLRYHVPVIRAYPLMLLRGTALFSLRQKLGLVEGLVPDGTPARIPVVVESPTFSRDDWQKMHRIAKALQATEGNHPASILDMYRS